MQNPIPFVRSIVLLSVFATAAVASAGVQSRVDADSFRALRGPMAPGAKVRLERLVVGDTVQTLELERFEVWAPNAEIVVDHGDGRREKIAPPPVQYFRGTLAGEPESMIFVAVRNDGAVDGFVFENDRRFRMRSQSARDVLIEDVTFDDELPADGGFSCDLDQAPILTPRGLPKVRSSALPGEVTSNGTLSPTGTWTLNMAIETDFELYQDLGSDAPTVTTFIGNLVGAASVIYQRDLSTDLVIAFTRIQATAADPFTVTPGGTGTWNGTPGTVFSTSHALAELGDIWANAGTRPFGGARSSVFLVSGKSQTAGVAWIGTSCGTDFACSGGNCGNALFNGHTGGAYAYMGLGSTQTNTTVPNPNATNNGILYGLPSNYWALLGFAHELGHNVDGPHTHCVALDATQKTTYGVSRNWIDECYSQGGSCFSGATSVPAEKGTIMSYCHLLGSSQSRFLFGQAGTTSELMTTRIRAFINGRTPASPAITAPASVGPGGSGNASISSPVGGLTYNWTIANGTINGATTGTSINFTASANPVTLRVRGTQANGCAASDFVNVTVNSCTAPSFTSLPGGATLTKGTTVELLAAASGTGPITYQWYIGSSGNTSTPADAGNPISVTPLTTTSYWVRATGSCGSADSPTITFPVVEPPTTNTSFYLVEPCRVIDTRDPAGPSGGPALISGGTRVLQITGVCGIPVTAAAVVANLTAVSPGASGFLAIYPTGSTWPGNSTLNYRLGRTRANNAILGLSGTGQVTVLNSGATQNFIIDVTGYFQ